MGLTGFIRWRRLRQKQGEERIQESPFDEENELLLAVYEAACAGEVTGSGKPSVQAVEKRLGRDITAADRDKAWEIVKPEFEK